VLDNYSGLAIGREDPWIDRRTPTELNSRAPKYNERRSQQRRRCFGKTHADFLDARENDRSLIFEANRQIKCQLEPSISSYKECYANCRTRALGNGVTAAGLAAIKDKLCLFQKILRLAESSLRPRCEE
jgi:hypothetical protein